MKKGDKVREIGDTLIGTIIKIKDGRADVLFQHIDNFITTKTFYYEYDNSGIEINA